MCASVFVYVLHVCRIPWKSEEDIKCHGTRVRGNCEPPCGFWEPNPGILQDQ